jgi:hypothetical protein
MCVHYLQPFSIIGVQELYTKLTEGVLSQLAFEHGQSSSKPFLRLHPFMAVPASMAYAFQSLSTASMADRLGVISLNGLGMNFLT